MAKGRRQEFKDVSDMTPALILERMPPINGLRHNLPEPDDVALGACKHQAAASGGSLDDNEGPRCR